MKRIGPWARESKAWFLFGEFPGISGAIFWGDSCLSLTGRDKPGKPVRVWVPCLEQPEDMAFRRIIYPDWYTKPVTVEAWPITSHDIPYYCWADSRGCIRFIERLTQ